MTMLVSLFLVVTTATLAAASCSGPNVTIFHGQLCGVSTPHYDKYLGIPYAEPPVGERRFKDPVPMRRWNGVRAATRECPVCAQEALPGVLPRFDGDEDCLCLNVYVPKGRKQKLAVMVWIHGGAFVGGSGNSDLYNPRDLVAHGVIVVTLNYRLGTLGFLNLGVSEASGSQGLKDQLQALLWVRTNIEHFGGDPRAVTIFGESAGAASVHLLTLSPIARGLFVRAIAESGSALNPWGFNASTACSTARLLQALGCPAPAGADASAALRCLRQASAEALQTPTARFVCEEFDQSGGLIAFQPSIDKKILPKRPRELATSCNNISMIVGFNSAEAILSLHQLRLTNGYADTTRGLRSGLNLVQAGANCSEAQMAARLQDWGARAGRFYMPDGRPISEFNLTPFLKYISFFSFIYGINKGLELRMGCPDMAPQFLYLFDVDTLLNHMKQLFGGVGIPGASHADELPYLFNMAVDEGLAYMPGAASLTKRRLVTMWTNFAKFGNPTPSTDQVVVTTKWKPYSSEKQNYLLINNNGLHEERHPFKEQTDFYESLVSECNQQS